MDRTWCALYILTWKCAPRHNGVHFFDISTSTSGPKLVCFVHFDFEMCFAPQRRALFRHLNCQKWSDQGVLCTFSLGNVLRATTACTFSTSQLPKAVRRSGVLYILTSKCASRHNGVQFFITHLASWLRTRRFSEPTFRPSGATNHWKNTVFRDFPTFSRICIFCLFTLSLLLFFLLISSNQISFFALSRLNSFWDTHQGLERRSSPGLDHAAAVQSNGQTTVVSYQFLHPQRSKHPQAITSHHKPHKPEFTVLNICTRHHQSSLLAEIHSLVA